MRIFSVFASALLAALGLVSSHQDLPNSTRDLRHCTEKLKERGIEARNVQRRVEFAKHLRQDRGLVQKSSYDISALNTSHLSTEDYTLSTPEAIIFATHGSCILSFEATVGNQYVAGEYIRRHVTEGQDGVPLATFFQVLDHNTCEPVEDVFVEIWSCNATGFYGGVSYNNPDDPNLDNTMLRGVQQTDSEGVVTFDTIFPGHYSVRANHIHVMVHPKGAAAADNGTVLNLSASNVGQVFFDQNLVHEVEALPVYTANQQVLTLNEDDGLMKQEIGNGSDPFMDYIRLGDTVQDGLLAWYVFGIDTSAKIPATPAAYLYAEGGVSNPELGG